jgi:indole-3-glycerol phosphate synthase
MQNFLDKIKRSTVARSQEIVVPANLTPNTVDFCRSFSADKMNIIAEIKFASPSKKQIYPGNLSHVEIAKHYYQHGAAAISVLTEPEFFKGNIQYIRDIKNALPDCPILLKDFILSRAQIAQGLAAGANAILLIVALLDPEKLAELYHYAVTCGLSVLLEVHTLEELKIALQLEPQLIGINNRDLTTLSIDLHVTERLVEYIPRHIKIISESGIQNKSDIARLSRLCDGFLIGTHFMQAADPGKALAAFMQEIANAC